MNTSNRKDAEISDYALPSLVQDTLSSEDFMGGASVLNWTPGRDGLTHRVAGPAAPCWARSWRLP